MTRNLFKFFTSQCDGLTSSVTFGSAPAFNKQFIISGLPLSAAMCKGVAPPAITFTLAPACTLKYAKMRAEDERMIAHP